MCLNKHYITNAYGKDILVKCGHCKACLQEKAIKRTQRITANVTPDTIALFCTFTYDNRFVPYIDLDELLTAPVHHVHEMPASYHDPVIRHDDSIVSYAAKSLDKDILTYKAVNIYRDCSIRYVRTSSDHSKYETRVIEKKQILDEVILPYPLLNTQEYKFLQNKKTFIGQAPHIGICYYKDAQDYIKRVRRRLSYLNYAKHFSYFICSEYGPTTMRPHFHALFFIPKEDYFFWKRLLSKVWTYDDGRQSFRNISIARKAAGYVSSYVNCDLSVPLVFRITPKIRPCHHYSQGFGMGYKAFSIRSVVESIKRRDMHYGLRKVKDNTVVVDRFLYPEYVLRRYFPKFKGFSCCSTDEIRFISERPTRLAAFARRLDYSGDDLHKNIVMLQHKQKFFLEHGFSHGDYADFYSQVWLIRNSNLLGDLYESIVQPSLNFYAYDNINQYYYYGLGSESFDQLEFVRPYAGFLIDPNCFPDNLQKHYSLVDHYNSYSKDRKIRNKIYSKLSYFNV